VSGTTKKSSTSKGMPFRYTPGPDHWDEALLRSGFPRRHWRKLAVAIGRMGLEALSRRWQTGLQLIQTNGITYNIYGDPLGKERAWSMDPIPMVVDGQEWAKLESAVVQRATLLNAVLSDLYGEQRLIRDKRIPAALLFGSPHFLRPCHGIVPPRGIHLHTYAADLARSPDGSWWVISDRTQAPSGTGYALENRLVSARTLPSVFDQCRVRQLNGFFNATHDALLALAPNARTNPRVVLLTPGPYNETYFEHSFLARHWNFPLVEGADLTVRDNRVYLKTLAGLEQVDLILRRLDDGFCDPLELRGDSVLGVPGLLGAIRAGHVAVTNALGSGLLDSSAHLPFLPGLSNHILGEKLALPSIATWWCGQQKPRQYVLDHLDEVVVKSAFPRPGQKVEFPATLDKKARAELAARIEANPEQYVAQEQVALSTAPVRTEQGLSSRHIVLRVFATWNGESYTVLPGGLTRVSTEDRSLVVSMQMGGGSKDTWVLAAPGSPHESQRSHKVTAAATLAIGIVAPRSTGELPSRVADNLFWLGRYGERLEATVRLVRALLPGLSGEEDYGRSASLGTIVRFLTGLNHLPPEFASASIAQQRYHVQRIMSRMIYDPTRSSGIGRNLKQIRRVTWPLKERLSQDTWRVLQQLETEFSSAMPVNPDMRFIAEMNLLDKSIFTLAAFSGLIMENTTRGYGWYFLDIGRRLERALLLADLIRTAIVEAPFRIEPYLEMLLLIADSSITYRTRYLTSLRVELVLELLLADEANPRSVAFQLTSMEHHIQELPRTDSEGEEPEELLLIQKAIALVRDSPLEDLAERDADGNLVTLEKLIVDLKAALWEVSDELTARYLSHLAPSRLTSSR
jgi:uncharacterized circularly permuted ATP-grasp superfamily protein/uncharacterized alpha-E superfamily protein